MNFLTWSIKNAEYKKLIENIPIFNANHKHDIDHVTEAAPTPHESAKSFMLALKNNTKLLTTRTVKLDYSDETSVMEKEFSAKKLNHVKKKKRKNFYLHTHTQQSLVYIYRIYIDLENDERYPLGP